MSLPRITARDAIWSGTKQWLQSQIADQQIQLERSDLTEAQHNLTRGRIAQLRFIISEVEPGAIPEDTSPSYFS